MTYTDENGTELPSEEYMRGYRDAEERNSINESGLANIQANIRVIEKELKSLRGMVFLSMKRKKETNA